MENINYVSLILPIAVAVVLTFVPFTWKHVVSPYVTVIHEYGHAVSNILTLGRPHSIKVHFADKGGVTHSLRRNGFLSGFGTVFSGLTGYPAPIFFGLALICSISGDYTKNLVLGSAIAFLIFVFLMRNIAGFILAIATALYFAIAYVFPPYMENMALWAGALMLIAGTADMFRLVVYYFKGLSQETDLGLLQDRFWLPKWFWLILMLAEILFFSWLILQTA